jgi:hypothetical protein
MTTIIEKITVCSEDGDSEFPALLEMTMDGSKPTCPVTFWFDKKPVFSMAVHEIEEFCKELSRLDCSN